MSYLLSIIVPTKNRYQYLKSIIETFYSMDNGEVELIIQDNSEENLDFLNYLSGINSENIKYYHHKNHLTVVENFDKGILNASGDYISMIGDDDTYSTKIIDIVKYLKENNIESAIFNKAKYKWPDLEFHYHQLPSLTIPKFSSRIISISPEKELIKCLEKGAVSLGKMPEIYHGIVKRSTLDQVFNKCNTYFPGASPDMAIAVALSLVVKTHVYIDAPYTISGHAYKSAGGQGARHKHKGKLSEIEWLANDIEDHWEKKIPMIWTGPTIYAESALKAMKNMGFEKGIKKFNYQYHYAWFAIFHPESKNLIQPYNNKSGLRKVKFITYSMQIIVLRFKNFLKNILMTRFNITNNKVVDNLQNSNEASIKIDEVLSNS